MAKDVLTPAAIRKGLALGRPHKLFDGAGLFLDIRSASSASWVFKFTDGKPDEAGLGSFFKLSPMIDNTCDMTLVRQMRDRCIGLVAEGKNPRLVLRAEKEAKRIAANAVRPMAIGELVRANIHLIAKRAKSDEQRQAWIDSLQFDRIGPIARMLPEEVTDGAAKLMMEAYYAKAPVMADDVRQRLYRVMVWALTPEQRNPFRWEGHLEKWVTRAETETSHASLPHDQIGGFLARVRGENDRVTMALALEWLILSASRADEACGADWSEIDWRNECWAIPEGRMKMRREHAVPLTERHFEILAKLKPPGTNEYPASGPIFSLRPGKPVSVTGLRGYMQSFQVDGKPYADPATGKPITLHGFRSTMRTWAEEQMADDGIDNLYSEKTMEACLAHLTGDATRNKYVRSKAVAVRRHITSAWADYCGVVQAAKVAPLRMRKAA